MIVGCIKLNFPLYTFDFLITTKLKVLKHNHTRRKGILKKKKKNIKSEMKKVTFLTAETFAVFSL